ncbi:MAG: lipoprotein LenA [Leptospiraceae bacterium]|jgi:lipoprotein LenA|nr:lipoprotein LenA [Leptospiraceae bacterium]
MRKSILLILVSLTFFVLCKPKMKEAEAQILGTRYSKIDQHISSIPGSAKKEHRVTLVYALEEVNVLEKVTEDKKDFYKLSTVTGKEGYSLASNFSEAVLFVVKDGLSAFRKPTLTAGTKGKFALGSICFVKEIQGEWANVDCLTSSVKDGLVEDWYDVWIQAADERLSKDPLLGQTALLIREAYKIITKANKLTGTDRDKLLLDAKDRLMKAYEKEDVLQPVVTSILIKYQMMDEPPSTPVAPPEQTQNPSNPQ